MFVCFLNRPFEIKKGPLSKIAEGSISIFAYNCTSTFVPNCVLLDKSAQSFGYAAGLTTFLYRRREGGIQKKNFNVRL